MRTLVIVSLVAGAVAVFAPDQRAGLMRSVVHGFGWGIGREVAHSMFGHRAYGRLAPMVVIQRGRIVSPNRTSD